MMIEAAARLRLTAAPNKPNRSKDKTWLKKAENKQKGKPVDKSTELPEGLFEKNPSEIANTLKTKSRDFQHAISRLTFYINRSGDNLNNQTKRRLDQAKEALYRSYGKEQPKG